MWLFAMFDLPTLTKEEKRDYTRFRKFLLSQGFMMMQYSVYARYCASEEASELHRKRVRKVVPSGEGQVRLISITDHQFGKMEIFRGKKRESPEQQPPQMLLF